MRNKLLFLFTLISINIFADNISLNFELIEDNNNLIILENGELFIYNIDKDNKKLLTRTKNSIKQFIYSKDKKIGIIGINSRYIDGKDSLVTKTYKIDFINKTIINLFEVDKNENRHGIVLYSFNLNNSDQFIYSYRGLYLNDSDKDIKIDIDNKSDYKQTARVIWGKNSFIISFYGSWEGILYRLYNLKEGRVIEDELTVNDSILKYSGGSSLLGFDINNRIIQLDTFLEGLYNYYLGYIKIYDIDTKSYLDSYEIYDSRNLFMLNSNIYSTIDILSKDMPVLGNIINKSNRVLSRIDLPLNVQELSSFSWLPNKRAILGNTNSLDGDLLTTVLYNTGTRGIYDLAIYNIKNGNLNIIEDYNIQNRYFVY